MYKEFKKGDLVLILPVLKKEEVPHYYKVALSKYADDPTIYGNSFSYVRVGEVILSHENPSTKIHIRVGRGLCYKEKDDVFLVTNKMSKFIKMDDYSALYVRITPFIYYLMSNNNNPQCLELCELNNNIKITENDLVLTSVSVNEKYIRVRKVSQIKANQKREIAAWYSDNVEYSWYGWKLPEECALLPKKLYKDLIFTEGNNGKSASISTEKVLRFYLENSERCNKCPLIKTE